MTEFQIAPGYFVDALGDALIFAANDWTLPVISAVYLEGAKGEQSVTFTATDRFMLGQRRASTVEPLTDDVAALISADQVKVLLGVHKPSARARRVPVEPLAVKVGDTHLAVGQVSVPLDTVNPFVKYRTLWPSKEEQIEELGVDLALLARLAKLSVFGRSSKGVRITSGGKGRPLNVECIGHEDEVRIAVMPYRLPERAA